MNPTTDTFIVCRGWRRQWLVMRGTGRGWAPVRFFSTLPLAMRYVHEQGA